MSVFVSCFNCERRFPGCHDRCEDYLAEKAKRDAVKAAKVKTGADAYELDKTLAKLDSFYRKTGGNRKVGQR